MEELIVNIAQSLVDNPKTVQVERSDEEEKTLFELIVSPEDRGKVIGKQGRTIRAIRHLVSAMASREGRTSRLEIRE